MPAPAPVPHWPVWLCFPGSAHDYCDANLSTESIDAKGHGRASNPQIAANPPIDCFYVYPTVSLESRGNSDLKIETTEQQVAVDEASPFSQVCRVFAPMYHQVTAYADEDGFKSSSELEYSDVLAAWRDYLAHDNDGRGVVLIGHSEGSFILKRLIREVIQPSLAERKLLVSALLFGGDVIVANQGHAGDMPDTPACASRTQIDCVVGYSSFLRPPPKDSFFESVANHATEHVLCVNPVDPGSTSAEPITPWFPTFDSAGVAPLNYGAKWFWVALPHLYTAQCVRRGSMSWLLVRRIHTAGDPRPSAQQLDGADSGLHEADMTIDLPELVALVRSESTAYRARRR